MMPQPYSPFYETILVNRFQVFKHFLALIKGKREIGRMRGATMSQCPILSPPKHVRYKQRETEYCHADLKNAAHRHDTYQQTPAILTTLGVQNLTEPAVLLQVH